MTYKWTLQIYVKQKSSHKIFFENQFHKMIQNPFTKLWTKPPTKYIPIWGQEVIICTLMSTMSPDLYYESDIEWKIYIPLIHRLNKIISR